MSARDDFYARLLALVRDAMAQQHAEREAMWERLRAGPRRRPPESGLAVPAEPPRGPQPLQGGAAVAIPPRQG